MLLEDPVSGLELTAVLPSLRTERGKNCHDLLLQWKDHFARIDVPVNVVTAEAGDPRLQDPQILYVEDPDVITRLNAWQEKTVFGSKVKTVRSSLFLTQGDEILVQVRRIREATLKKLWLKAFDLQMDAVRQDLENRMD